MSLHTGSAPGGVAAIADVLTKHGINVVSSLFVVTSGPRYYWWL
jgi:hypothetical protein